MLSALSACASHGSGIASVMEEHGSSGPTPSAFTVCHGHGCTKTQKVGLTAEEWQSVVEKFDGVHSAETERASLRRAIAQMERLAGAKSATDRDVGGTFEGYGRSGQLDCVDEMVNTATYITLFRDAGLLRHHDPGRRVSTGFFEASFWPHTASTIRDRSTGAEIVVDSWLLDNGEPPYLVPLAHWEDGSWRDDLTRYQ